MSESSRTHSHLYRPFPEAAASLSRRELAPTESWGDLTAFGFELVSRGDFVPGVLHLPPSRQPTPAPLVLLVHPAGGSAWSPALGFSAAWVREGLAVATIDLPLHGKRASPKLSARLLTTLETLRRGEPIDPESEALVEEFARQATSDLIRTADALARMAEIDSSRIGLMGLGAGAIACAYALAHDRRPAACVLAGGCGRLAHASLDPARLLAARAERLGRHAPCPTLVLASATDSETKTGAARSLFEALLEPREFVVLEDAGSAADCAAGSAGLPEAGIDAAFAFLRKRLDDPAT